jgi:hypothetical protein
MTDDDADYEAQQQHQREGRKERRKKNLKWAPCCEHTFSFGRQLYIYRLHIFFMFFVF